MLPTVVNITSFVNLPPNPTWTVAATGDGPKTLKGSGFIIDPSGVILSNFHVVDGAYDVIVKFSNGESVQGHILSTDTRIDLALIKVNLDHSLPVIHWADSDSLQVGDTVLAIKAVRFVELRLFAGIHGNFSLSSWQGLALPSTPWIREE